MVTILVVDTSECVRAFLEDKFTSEGYVVATTGDLSSVNDSLISLNPDLVITDLYYDGVQRWDVLFDIKKYKPDLPVILFTARDGCTKDRRISLADRLVIKGVFLDELKEKIAEVLKMGPVPSIEREREAIFPAIRTSVSSCDIRLTY